MPEPLACTEDGEITWFKRDGCTAAQARRFVVEESGTLAADCRVTRCHLRQLTATDCPVHGGGAEVEIDEDGFYEGEDDCRCSQIEEGWWEECSHRLPDAVPAWRVAWRVTPAKTQPHSREGKK